MPVRQTLGNDGVLHEDRTHPLCICVYIHVYVHIYVSIHMHICTHIYIVGEDIYINKSAQVLYSFSHSDLLLSLTLMEFIAILR